VRYGFQRRVGRNTVWRSVGAPPVMSPPTWLGLASSICAAVRVARAITRSAKPGAKRSICASIAPVMSSVEPGGTWQ